MNKNNRIMSVIKNSAGRYFGLYTKQGEAINARYVSDSPSYVTVYDRNSASLRKLSKSSVSGLRFQGVEL